MDFSAWTWTSQRLGILKVDVSQVGAHTISHLTRPKRLAGEVAKRLRTSRVDPDFLRLMGTEQDKWWFKHQTCCFKNKQGLKKWNMEMGVSENGEYVKNNTFIVFMIKHRNFWCSIFNETLGRQFPIAIS